MRHVHAVAELLQAHAGDGVEVSVSTTTSAVGVLVPVTEPSGVGRFVEAWCGMQGPYAGAEQSRVGALTPWFVRCDVDRQGWRALTVYGAVRKGVDDEGVPSPALLRVYCHSIRFEGSAQPEWATYFDVKGVAPGVLYSVLCDVARSLDFGSRLPPHVAVVHEQLTNLGWVQCLATAVRRRRIKLDVATHQVSGTLRAIAAWDASARGRIHGILRVLGGAIGYAGVTVDPTGVVGWRVYARPFACASIGDLLGRLLR